MPLPELRLSTEDAENLAGLRSSGYHQCQMAFSSGCNDTKISWFDNTSVTSQQYDVYHDIFNKRLEKVYLAFFSFSFFYMTIKL